MQTFTDQFAIETGLSPSKLAAAKNGNDLDEELLYRDKVSQAKAEFDRIASEHQDVFADNPTLAQAFRNERDVALESAGRQIGGGGGYKGAYEDSQLVPTLKRWEAGLQAQSERLTRKKYTEALKSVAGSGDLLKAEEIMPGALQNAHFVATAKSLIPKEAGTQIDKLNQKAANQEYANALLTRDKDRIEKAAALVEHPQLVPTVKAGRAEPLPYNELTPNQPKASPVAITVAPSLEPTIKPKPVVYITGNTEGNTPGADFGPAASPIVENKPSKSGKKIPEKAIEYLRKNPDKWREFDEWYGNGASNDYLP